MTTVGCEKIEKPVFIDPETAAGQLAEQTKEQYEAEPRVCFRDGRNANLQVNLVLAKDSANTEFFGQYEFTLDHNRIYLTSDDARNLHAFLGKWATKATSHVS